MKAEIIAVGTEILLGQIVNTNTTLIAQELAAIGVDLYYQSVVGDNPERLDELLTLAEKRSNLIILCGGLGPTKDDLTKQVTAKHLNQNLVIDERAMAKIDDFYQQAHRKMAENNRLQALIIEGSAALNNSTGMAAGILYRNQTHTYLLLPGPPNELEPMLKNEALPLLIQENEQKTILTSRVLRFFGIGESQLVTDLAEMIDQQTNPTIAPYAKTNEVTLRITAQTTSETEAKRLLDATENKILEKERKYFYGYGDDNSLAQTVVELLKEKKLTISAAESLTAGLFQSSLADIPGSSAVLLGGAVTYAPSAKMQLADVPAEIVEKYGTVSSECAQKMAEGIRARLDSDLGISLTGVAGPDELEGKAVGTVWIGLAQRNQPTQTIEFHLPRTRNFIRYHAVMQALNLVRQALI